MLWLVLKILIGFIVFWIVLWYWLLVGSRSHCPRCGSDLEVDYGRGGISHTVVSRSCACGWRRDD